MENIGKYQVIRYLGEGSSSTVWLCHDPFLNREVAIKLTKSEVRHDPRHSHVYRKLFLAEAALAGKLEHPHITSIYDAVDDEQQQYLVLEYVNGPTLESYCRPDALLEVAQVIEIIFKCARALAYAQEMGITHRDIKPANILATIQEKQIEQIKLTDFGTAFDHSSDTTLVAGIGSPAYMAPEQISNDTINAQTDLYSLGVVMYQLLTGHLPYEAPTNANLLYQILHVDPTPASWHRHDLPQEIENFLLKTLARKPTERYANWEEFSSQLAELAHLPETSASTQVADTTRFRLLRNLEFFRSFNDAQLWEVVRFGDWQRITTQHKIFSEGQPGSDFYLVAEGDLSVSRSGRLISHISAGECIGELVFLEELEQTEPASAQRSADVISDTPCTLIRISHSALRTASEGCQLHIERALSRLLVRRLRATNRRLPA